MFIRVLGNVCESEQFCDDTIVVDFGKKIKTFDALAIRI